MNLADDFFKKGLASYSVRDFSQAEGFFSSALTENPKNANYYYYRGECFSELGKIDEAISDYSKAIEFCPRSVVIRCCRAELFLSKKMTSEAEADFSKVISEASDDNRYWTALSYLGRGLIRVERGEIEEAIMDFSFAEDLADKEGDKGLSARIAQELEKSGI